MGGSFHKWAEEERTNLLGDDIYGDTRTNLYPNNCSCKCIYVIGTKKYYELSCTLSLGWLIRIAVDSSSVWSKIPASHPNTPAPHNWSSIPLEWKVAWARRHEMRHVQNLHSWYEGRRVVIENAERKIYDEGACLAIKKQLKKRIKMAMTLK